MIEMTASPPARWPRQLSGTAGPMLFMALYRWQEGPTSTLLVIAAVGAAAGFLLRQWWAVISVPSTMVGTMIAYALVSHGRLTIADMSPAAMMLSLGVMSMLMGCMALVGVVAGRACCQNR